MKMLYNSVGLVILFAVLCRMSQGEDTKTPSLPHPKLTVNQAGQVIRLECRPPADSEEVYELELLKQHEFAEQFSNVSLVHVTKREKEQPVFNLEDGEATFQGRWDKTAALVVTMPVELGLYYCTGDYKADSGWSGTFYTPVTVDKDASATVSYLPTKGTGGYALRRIRVHRVQVNWTRLVRTSDFIEARVSRQLGSKPARSMFFTMSGREGFLTGPDVILSSFRHEDGSSPVVTLYIRVHDNKNEAGARYDCLILYRDCVGSDVQLCKCIPEQEGDITTGLAPLHIAIILACVFFLTLVIVLAVIHCVVKHNKCKSVCDCFLSRPIQETDTETQCGPGPGGQAREQERASNEERPHSSSQVNEEPRSPFSGSGMQRQPPKCQRRTKSRTPKGHEEKEESTKEPLTREPHLEEMGDTDDNRSECAGSLEELASTSLSAGRRNQNSGGEEFGSRKSLNNAINALTVNAFYQQDKTGGQADISIGQGTQNLSSQDSVPAAAQSANIDQGGARPEEKRPPPALVSSTPVGSKKENA